MDANTSVALFTQFASNHEEFNFHIAVKKDPILTVEISRQRTIEETKSARETDPINNAIYSLQGGCRIAGIWL